MSKQFWTFLLVGLVVVGIAIYAILFVTKGSHLELKGEILKVRVLALNPTASLVMLDFRVTNPSDIPWVVKTADVVLIPASGDPVESARISKADVENVFKYEKLLGPKYNDVLSIKDRVNPHQTIDRMVGARIELPEAAIDKRKAMQLKIEELDGVMAELTETKK